MNFMVTLITDGTGMEGMPSEERDEFARRMGEFMSEIQQAGVLLHTDALGPVSDARTLRRKSGKVVVTDGPFAETKEQLGGFCLIDCEGPEDAMAWAKKVPLGPGGSIEVRAVKDLTPYGYRDVGVGTVQAEG